VAGALGTGNMVNKALVALGDSSVDAVINQAEHSDDRTVWQSACFVLQKMLSPPNRATVKNPEHQRRIQQVLSRGRCGGNQKD
jgi:hypothetical protein